MRKLLVNTMLSLYCTTMFSIVYSGTAKSKLPLDAWLLNQQKVAFYPFNDLSEYFFFILYLPISLVSKPFLTFLSGGKSSRERTKLASILEGSPLKIVKRAWFTDLKTCNLLFHFQLLHFSVYFTGCPKKGYLI